MNFFYNSVYESEFTFSEKVYRYIWNVIYITLFKYSPRFCFAWRATILRLFGAKIGSRCKIYPKVKIWFPKNLTIGDGVIIGDEANLYNVAPIILASEVTISQDAFLCTASHNIESPNRELITSSIAVDRGAWIFAGAFIHMGTQIGEGSIVGARSVVTKNVEAFDVIGGNPAKVIKKRKVDWLN
ncbi:MAG: putative colanic acid biosynthesis acetyltransferase [Coraliomargaritaceae bacterium]